MLSSAISSRQEVTLHNHKHEHRSVSSLSFMFLLLFFLLLLFSKPSISLFCFAILLPLLPLSLIIILLYSPHFPLSLSLPLLPTPFSSISIKVQKRGNQHHVCVFKIKLHCSYVQPIRAKNKCQSQLELRLMIFFFKLINHLANKTSEKCEYLIMIYRYHLQINVVVYLTNRPKLKHLP